MVTLPQLQNLVKQYKNGVQVLNGFNLTVEYGEVFALLGQNGAGKSTLINILTTYLRPTSGHVIVFEKDLYQEATFIRSQIACAAQRISIDTHLSLTENMMFQSRLYKVPGAEAKQRMENLIDCFGLERYRKYPVSSYSGGIARRLDIAMNMMSNPKIMFLDEPTTGMDIQSRMAMRTMLKQIKEEFCTTVFLTTHYLEEASQLSDTVCIMKDGQNVIQGSPHTLRGCLQQDTLKISFLTRSAAKAASDQLRLLYHRMPYDLQDNTITVNSGSWKDLTEINRWLLAQDISFTGIEISQPSLDDVFIRLTGAAEQEEVI